MKIMMLAAFLFSSFCASCIGDESPFLLTDNVKAGQKSKLLGEKVNVIETGASYKWVDSGEFATDPETLSTGSRPNGTSKSLFDGNSGYAETQSFSKWSGGSWATIRIDLKKNYVIDSLDVWALRDPQRDTEFAELLISGDGIKYIPYGRAVNNEVKRDASSFIKLSLKLDKAVSGQFVELRIKKSSTANQQQIADIAIWGFKADDKVSFIKAGERTPVRINANVIQDGVALISWAESAKSIRDAEKWRIYVSDVPFKSVSDEGVRRLAECPKKDLKTPVYPFEPGSTKYFAVTAVYKDGEVPDVEAVKVQFKSPFSCSNFGEMLAVNHFWSGDAHGGGANVPKANPYEWNEVVLDILAETPFRESRWWRMNPEVVKKFLVRGIGMTTFPNGAKNIENANGLGIYSFSQGNEPDLNSTVPKYLDKLKEVYTRAKSLNKWNTISAPTSGLEDHSIEWLDRFYAAGAKDYFDVLDLHTYTKIAGGHEVPAGYPRGAPEALFSDMEKIRAVMKKHGDDNKPFISTEFGFTECPGVSNPAGNITPQIKAQYLVRGLILHYVLGFKRVYVYSFWDDGEDPFYNEHLYGIIDYDCQKKPAFYAVCALGRILGDCTLEAPLENTKIPVLGYRFKNQKTAKFVTVLWDGSGMQSGTFSSNESELEVADIFGKTRKLIPGSGGRFNLSFGQSPVYIISSEPVKLETTKRIENTSSVSDEEKIKFNSEKTDYIVAADANSLDLNLKLVNPFKNDIKVKLVAKDASGKDCGTEELRLLKSSDTVHKFKVMLSGSDDSFYSKYSLLLVYSTDFSSYAEEIPVYVRKLVKLEGGVSCVTRKVDKKTGQVYILANRFIEASFDPAQGGRLMELIDRKSMTNQIHLDYEKVPVLKSFAFEYAVWFSTDGLRNAQWKVSGFSNGNLKLTSPISKNGLAYEMNWKLDADLPVLKLNIKAQNKSQKDVESVFNIHPEYNVSGCGESTRDIMEFPLEKEVFKLPFWAGLGEKKVPGDSKTWWRIYDTQTKLELRQDYPEGWETPRIWFDRVSYNVEMNAKFKLKPEEVWETNLTWTLGEYKN